MSFSDLGLSAKVLEAVAASGYNTPTPIQREAIPHVMARRDVLGIAQTGTGKTAAFTLPMLTQLEQGRARARMPRTLILEPTRELAAQVEEAFVKYGAAHKLSVALLIGGVSFGDQDAKITRGVDVLIATPGRLLDHFERGKLLLTGVEMLVIDEADRMLDMGFIPDIERICKMVPFTRQTLFFTATMPPEITRIAQQFLHNPVRVEVARPSSTAATITQKLVASHAKDYEKRATLRRLIDADENLKNAIIFCNRKTEVAALHRSLVRHGYSAGALHGDLDQRSRMQALDAFRKGELALLVCSDVAARGLDIPDVSHVFNYDVPIHAEDYVHRIGRTGRAGKLGTAITIVTKHDDRSMSAIEKLTQQAIIWEGPKLDELPPPEPSREGDSERKPRRTERPRGRDKDRDRKRREDGSDRPQREREILERAASGEPAPAATSRPAPRRPETPRAETPRAEPRRAEPARAPVRQPAANDEGAAIPVAREPRRDSSPEPRPERKAEPRRPEHQSQRRPDRRDDDGPSVTGMGDHMPAFLMRPTGRKAS